MSVSSLPPLAATPVLADARLAYVRRHLALAYPGAPVELLGYAEQQLPVTVAALDNGFFAQQQAYPAAPAWREWAGQRVPFFFDENSGAPLLAVDGTRVTIAADLISAAFYLLSGWQEYFSAERDQHGRFPYAASVQQQYGFVALPVVNYYFDVLRTALEQVTGRQYPPRRWGPQQAEFAAFISHDVDNLRSAWKAPAKAALRQGHWLDFGRRVWQHLTQPDAWDNLETVAAQVAQYGGRSTFFILPEHKPAANGTRNADYRLTRRLRQRLGKLEKQGFELGLHGSLGAATSENKLEADAFAAATGIKVPFPSPSFNVRFHYLSWEPRQTIGLLATAGTRGPAVSYDSTLGFAEHYGFRHSYCQPFYPFDFVNGTEAEFLEIPLNVMDTTLHHPRYLQLAPAEILPTLAPMLVEIQRFGGVASVLWHNENFDPANERNGPRQFHKLMGHLQAAGAAFLTGREVFAEFTQPYAGDVSR